ncbi:glycosyl transferase group 1 [Cellvibrio zantedeschiae]|uniref:Glycosyl transferase group 1 n=1 Tax=Cellvibrio zantedeschiae TaxID=1237077 RepID=A0ABQ3AQV4_9GAMM|nr:glycosyltransferase family 4 protein [Cellvibrio zantedeschiae]GGY64423.1 glycosyl transferase group 1 [Cellvibrio zantedeschiae]
MNILHISGVLKWGGGENHIQNLCFELAQSNPEVNNIILCVDGGQFHQKLTRLKIKFFTARRRRRIDFNFISTIIKLCKQESIDLIHLHDPTAMQLTIIADHFSSLPPFVLSRKISYPIRRNFLTLYKYNYKKIKKYLCVSDETRRTLEVGVKDKSKAITVYHGTRIDNKSDVTPFKLREKLGIAEDIKIVGNIANHYPAKDLFTYVRTINRLINEHGRKDVHFVQIGSPADKTPEIMALVKAYNLEAYVSFLGFTEDASNFIPQFDIGFMSSKLEGIAQFLYECFYHRVPIVTTNAGGAAEIIKQGETGFIADKGDDEALARHLVYVLDHPEESKVITENGNKLLYSQFITPVMAQKTLAVYREIIADETVGSKT